MNKFFNSILLLLLVASVKAQLCGTYESAVVTSHFNEIRYRFFDNDESSIIQIDRESVYFDNSTSQKKAKYGIIKRYHFLKAENNEIFRKQFFEVSNITNYRIVVDDIFFVPYDLNNLDGFHCNDTMIRGFYYSLKHYILYKWNLNIGSIYIQDLGYKESINVDMKQDNSIQIDTISYHMVDNEGCTPSITPSKDVEWISILVTLSIIFTIVLLGLSMSCLIRKYTKHSVLSLFNQLFIHKQTQSKENTIQKPLI
ncbi:hypothetical protein WA158_004966 [Blastocystis sp. Blastoise]